jgi:tRNA pseudouridine(55) synthase
MEGIVLFNKPKNYTSYQIVEFFKKKTKKKVGHGGTLDPLAEGLLILGIGDYTKELNKFLKESIKTYIAEIILGARSTTYDKEGRIYPNDDRINYPDIDRIKEVVNSFIGEIEQIPPPFSAVKIKGKPAYLLARKGKKVELKPRKVKIYEIKILSITQTHVDLTQTYADLMQTNTNLETNHHEPFTNNKNPRKSVLDPYKSVVLKIEVTCSSGTYIRSLANDIGEKLGCGGYLNDLKRTKIILTQTYADFTQTNADSKNVFTMKQALTFEDIENNFLEFYAKVYGRVQGVGYRYFVKEKVQSLDIFGYVKNLEDGTVEVLAQGREENLQKLIEELKKGPFLSRVDKLDVVFRKPLNIFSNFWIEH